MVTADNSKKATTHSVKREAVFAAIFRHIREFRAERKALRSLYNHHTKEAAKLAQAERDVNKVWY